MTKNKFTKPDYKHWAKAETWSQNKAAFLLNGIDPDQYPNVNLGMREIPSELEKARKTFKIIRSIPWNQRYPEYYYPNVGLNPIAIITEALEKNLPIPAPLKKLILKHNKQKQDCYGPVNTTSDNVGSEGKSLARRERNNYLKTIGLLVAMFLDEKNRASKYSSEKISASHIARLIFEKAEDIEMDTSGLKSIDRKITEAIDLINEESMTPISL